MLPLCAQALLLLIALPTMSGSAQTTDSPQPQAALLAALQGKFERIDELQLSEWSTGARGRFFVSGDLTPRGQRAAAQTKLGPESAAAAALAIASELLKFDMNEFAAKRTAESTDGQGVTHRRYDFVFHGWRVEDFALLTHVRDDGTLTAINGNVVRFLAADLSTLRSAVGQDVIDAGEAEAIVIRALDGRLDGNPRVDKVILTEPPYLFWTVDIGTRNPLGAWRYYVNAQSGVIRNRVDLMIRSDQ